MPASFRPKVGTEHNNMPMFGELQGMVVGFAGFRVLCMDHEPAALSFIQPVDPLDHPGLWNILARRGCSEGQALT